jgi:hypothetical protein
MGIGWVISRHFFSKVLYSTIPFYSLINLCYDFEIPERIKQKSRIDAEKEEQEKEELEPIKVPN